MTRSSQRILSPIIAAVAAVLLAAGTAEAVQPKQWTQRSESDFKEGKVEDLVISSRGDLKLASATEDLEALPDEMTVVNAMKKIDGRLYVAGGPEAKILVRGDDGFETAVELDREQVFAMAEWKGQLLVGISADNGSRLSVLDDGELKDLIAMPGDVRYIWALIVDGDRVFAATGTEGRVYQVRPDDDPPEADDNNDNERDNNNGAGNDGDDNEAAGNDNDVAEDEEDNEEADQEAEVLDPRITVILDVEQKNVLSLGRDGDGRIYAGTDTDGIVYRTHRGPDGQWKSFALFDAAEAEIGALLVLDDGTVYAGTADAEQARPGMLARPSDDRDGRPVPDEPLDEPGPAPDEPDPDPADDAEVAPAPPADLPDDVEAPEAPDAPAMPDEPGDGEVAPEPDEGPGNGEEGDALPVPDDEADSPGEQLHGQHTELQGRFDSAARDRARVQQQGEPIEGREAPVSDEPIEIEPPEGDVEGPPMGEPADEPPMDDGFDAPPADDGDDRPLDEAAPPGEADPEAVPTPEQRDALREEIRARLERARETGAIEAAPGRPDRPVADRPDRDRPRPSPAAARTRPSGQGNAIYEINPDGFVKEIFRESVMILAIVQDGRSLLVGTGNEGQLFRIKPGAQEHTTLVELESKQIPALELLENDDGEHVLLGAANPGALVRLDPAPAGEGVYTSKVFDAEQISLWGTFKLGGELPRGTHIQVKARSGNISDPEKGNWTEWTEPVTLRRDPDKDPYAMREVRFSKDQLPPARFFQYRLVLRSGEGEAPLVNATEMNYIMPNLAPHLKSVKAEYEGRGGRGRVGSGDPDPINRLRIQWEAEDPNDDKLIYKLEYRASDSERWLTLAEDITDSNHTWDTRRVPDGRYLIRVTASDAPDNPPGMEKTARRQSEPVLIDNSAPEIAEPEVEVEGRAAELRFEVTDNLSGVQAVHFVVNEDDNWRLALPEDMIYDSTTETIAVTIPDLPRGHNVITLRATDRQGNTRYRAVNVHVPN